MSAPLEAQKSRAEVTGLIGESLDGALQGAHDRSKKCLGGSEALKAAAKGAEKLYEHIEKDLEDDLVPKKAPKEECAEYAKKYVRRAIEGMLNLSEKFKADELVANGEVEAYSKSLELVKRHHETAVSRGVQIAQAMAERIERPDEPEPEKKTRRRPGERPGEPEASKRKKTAAKKKVAPKKSPSKVSARKKAKVGD